ncbi:MAG: hypothetical protein WD850_01800 [Candidatus Spechtbacterales bacterium]
MAHGEHHRRGVIRQKNRAVRQHTDLIPRFAQYRFTIIPPSATEHPNHAVDAEKHKKDGLCEERT